MTSTTALAERSSDSDSDLWRLVCQGSAESFEVLVRRHQSVVTAVAYNACGNLALSEDVAQETFWAAWRERESLEQPSRLRPWLCGIARNLGKSAVRRASRPAESAACLAAVTEPSTAAPGPAEEAVSREEESLVWTTLERIPESYREPLILFYREGQSTAEVAAALDLSEDAVRQRLSRGRTMLRERVSGLVEGTLRRSQPGRPFTVAVMTGLAAGTAGATTATAAGVGAASSSAVGAAVKAAAGAGVSGGLFGWLFGLTGGWLGTWIPAQLAPTKRERDHLLRVGRRMLLASLAFTVTLIGLMLAFAGRRGYPVAWGAWFVMFEAYIVVEAVRLARAVKRIRVEAGPGAEPNDTALRAGLDVMASRFRGRVFRSRATFLGLPLIDMNVSDPPSTGRTRRPDLPGEGPRVARGWVAVGDRARGLVLGVGPTATGFVAVGGRAVGVLSFGGLAVGLVAVGGCSLGLLGIGGFGLGVYAFGGLAFGWWACGGGAVGWDVACGGFAAARHAAFGGAAFAYDYALGGGGWARHFNDAAARALLHGHPLQRGLEWYAANVAWSSAAVVVLGLLLPCAVLSLMYRRDRGC